jgi:hypothetical protein
VGKTLLWRGEKHGGVDGRLLLPALDRPHGAVALWLRKRKEGQAGSFLCSPNAHTRSIVSLDMHPSQIAATPPVKSIGERRSDRLSHQGKRRRFR